MPGLDKIRKEIIEDKMEEITQAKNVVKVLQQELKELEEMDLSEIDVYDYEY